MSIYLIQNGLSDNEEIGWTRGNRSLDKSKTEMTVGKWASSYIGGEVYGLAYFNFNKEIFPWVGKSLLLQDQGGARGMTSSFAVGMEVRCAGQQDSSLKGRGLVSGRKKENRESLDGPV